jgi:hypothetical protein
MGFVVSSVVNTMASDVAMLEDEITSSIGEEILKASVEEINSRCRLKPPLMLFNH